MLAAAELASLPWSEPVETPGKGGIATRSTGAVAIRIGSGLDPAAIARKLSETASVLCASPAYLRQRGVPEHPDDLKAHACLTYTNFGSEEWTLLRDGDQANVPVHGPFRTNDALALRRAALTGLGIAMLPRFALEALLASVDLERVLPGWEPRVLPIHALYLSRQHLPAAARALIDHLVRALAKQRRHRNRLAPLAGGAVGVRRPPGTRPNQVDRERQRARRPASRRPPACAPARA